MIFPPNSINPFGCGGLGKYFGGILTPRRFQPFLNLTPFSGFQQQASSSGVLQLRRQASFDRFSEKDLPKLSFILVRLEINWLRVPVASYRSF